MSRSARKVAYRDGRYVKVATMCGVCDMGWVSKLTPKAAEAAGIPTNG